VAQPAMRASVAGSTRRPLDTFETTISSVVGLHLYRLA
jgi:hypothetical protein